MNLLSKMQGGDAMGMMGGQESLLGNSPEMATSEGDSAPPAMDMKAMLGGGSMGRSPNSLREKAMSAMKK